MEPVKTVLRNVFFGSQERTTREPACGNKDEIIRSEINPDIRKIAPYVMQVHRENEEVYIRYAAAIGIKTYQQENKKLLDAGVTMKLSDQLICLAFDVYLDYLVAYAGYFVVDKSALLTAEGATVETVHITPMEEVSTQLGMLLMLNCKLKSFDEYFASDSEPNLVSLTKGFTEIMSQEVISFWNGFRDLRPMTDAPDQISQSLRNQEDDGNETDALSDVSVLGINPASKVPTTDEVELGSDDSADTVPFEDLIFEDQTVVLTMQDLKNRKRILFRQEHVEIERSDRWIENIVDSHQVWKLSRSELVTHDECRDLVFCPTKYYAGIAAGSSKEILYYKRVFLIGQCLDQFLVIPYNNTDNREELTLLSPFGTEILYQRFNGDCPSEHDVPVQVDSVDVDSIHIPDFVAISDVYHILKYWKTCTSEEERVLARLISRLHTEPDVPTPLEHDTCNEGAASPRDQKRKIDWNLVSSTPKKSKIESNDSGNFFGDDESPTADPIAESQLDEQDYIGLSLESNDVETDLDKNGSEDCKDFVKDVVKDSNGVDPKDWDCVMDNRTKRICQINMTLSTAETKELIDHFVPFKQIHTCLKDFMTNKWGTAYLGLTDYFAECPISSSEERSLFLNVLVLGYLEDVFIILPVKVNLLTTKMKIGHPCATHNLYTRRNRDWFMRKLERKYVDLSIPTSYNIPEDQFAQVLKYRYLVASGAPCFQKAIYTRCTKR